MRTLLQLLTVFLAISLYAWPIPAGGQTIDRAVLAQVVTPPPKQTTPAPAPRTLQQVSPPRQISPAAPAPASGKRSLQPVTAKSTILTLEQENKSLKDRVAKQDLIILNLTSRLEQAEKTGALVAIRAKQLSEQIEAMTKPGGSLVRAYCEGEYVSRNTAGAANNCASSGYACEPVSGLCFSRCSRTNQCALGWVCDPQVASCIRAR